jgi:hypothetical protein
MFKEMEKRVSESKIESIRGYIYFRLKERGFIKGDDITRINQQPNSVWKSCETTIIIFHKKKSWVIKIYRRKY